MLRCRVFARYCRYGALIITLDAAGVDMLLRCYALCYADELPLLLFTISLIALLRR